MHASREGYSSRYFRGRLVLPNDLSAVFLGPTWAPLGPHTARLARAAEGQASHCTSNLAAKWARSSALPPGPASPGEPLFFQPDGTPLPVLREPDPGFRAHGFLRDGYESRGVAMAFNPERSANLLLRLRAFLGVNARCEILAYLLLNGRGSPRAVARACGYYPATVTKALAEMGDSGYVVARVEGRHRHYALCGEAWRSLLIAREPSPWITWPPLFRALEQAWEFLNAPDRAAQTPLAQASALRRVLRESLVDQLAASGLPIMPGDDRRHAGEAVIPFFIAQMREIFDILHRLG